MPDFIGLKRSGKRVRKPVLYPTELWGHDQKWLFWPKIARFSKRFFSRAAEKSAECSHFVALVALFVAPEGHRIVNHLNTIIHFFWKSVHGIRSPRVPFFYHFRPMEVLWNGSGNARKTSLLVLLERQ